MSSCRVVNINEEIQRRKTVLMPMLLWLIQEADLPWYRNRERKPVRTVRRIELLLEPRLFGTSISL